MSAADQTAEEEDDTIKNWGSRMCCFVCRQKHGLRVRAVVRIFSGWGGWAGEGWPACEEHRSIAENEALAPLNEPKTPIQWKVTAYEVTADDHGCPKLGRKLWSAAKRVS